MFIFNSGRQKARQYRRDCKKTREKKLLNLCTTCTNYRTTNKSNHAHHLKRGCQQKATKCDRRSRTNQQFNKAKAKVNIILFI